MDEDDRIGVLQQISCSFVENYYKFLRNGSNVHRKFYDAGATLQQVFVNQITRCSLDKERISENLTDIYKEVTHAVVKKIIIQPSNLHPYLILTVNGIFKSTAASWPFFHVFFLSPTIYGNSKFIISNCVKYDCVHPQLLSDDPIGLHDIDSSFRINVEIIDGAIYDGIMIAHPLQNSQYNAAAAPNSYFQNHRNVSQNVGENPRKEIKTDYSRNNGFGVKAINGNETDYQIEDQVNEGSFSSYNESSKSHPFFDGPSNFQRSMMHNYRSATPDAVKTSKESLKEYSEFSAQYRDENDYDSSKKVFDYNNNPPTTFESCTEYSVDTNTIFVGSYPESTTEEDIIRLFSKFGSITTVKMIPQKKIAFVSFKNPSSVSSALRENELRIGDRILRVQPRKVINTFKNVRHENLEFYGYTQDENNRRPVKSKK